MGKKVYIILLSLPLLLAFINIKADSISGKQDEPVYGDVNIYDPKTQIPDGIEPLIDVWMRDPVITLGRDGEYILTGTTRSPENQDLSAIRWNDGLRAWRSYDLKNWETLGLVWKLDDGPEWIRNFHVYYPDGAKLLSPEEFVNNIPHDSINMRRSLWSPRIIYSKKYDTYLAACSMSFNMGIPKEKWLSPIFGGTFILKSTSGKPEGPYVVTSERPLTYYIDCRIFEDDDETLFFIWQNGNIAKLNDKLDAIYEYHSVWQESFSPEPVREGIHLFKHNGLYHLVLSMYSHQSDEQTTYNHTGHGGNNAKTYDAVIASSKSIYGPYGKRYTSITNGGHGNHFLDTNGNWWASVFYPKEPDKSNIAGIRPRLIPMQWEGSRILPKK